MKTYTQQQVIVALAVFRLKAQEAGEKLKDKEYRERTRQIVYETCDLLGISRHTIEAFIQVEKSNYDFIAHVEKKAKEIIEEE